MTNPRQHPLLLPEILSQIGLLLSRHDLISSLRVCSTWNRSLNPLLWATTLLPEQWKIQKDPTISPSAEILHRNALYILNLFCWDLFLINELTPECTRLEKLHMHCFGPQVKILVEQSHKTLKEVHLKRSAYMDAANADDSVRGLIGALDRCEKLERVVLKNFIIQQPRLPAVPASTVAENVDGNDNEDVAGSNSNELNIVQEFYRVIRRVSTLELRNDGVMEPPTPVLATLPPSSFDVPFTSLTFNPTITEVPLPPVVPFASPDFIPSLPNLRRLVLFGSKMNMLDQVRLLHHCPNLVSLHWHLRGTTSVLNNLGSELYFTFLKLQYLDLTWSTILDDGIAAVLSRCPNLTHLKLPRTLIGPLSLAIITGKELIGGEDEPPSGSMVSVSDGLRHKLVELDISECFDIKSSQIQRILTRCTRLRSFWASDLETSDIADVTKVGEEGSKPWECLDLESLHINIIARRNTASTSEPQQQQQQQQRERERMLEQQRKALAQVGKLTKLRTLSLEPMYIDPNRAMARREFSNLDLSLESGLDKLSGLRGLRVFVIRRLKHKMDCEEYEWMAKHWIHLRQLLGRLCPLSQGEDREEEEEEMRVFVQDLMPQVEIREEARAGERNILLPVDYSE
ncbi:hypothetical protein BGX26_012862 [Mortierella sp. AD094]|nr:hypothetical protein BGX26_012862 [Mortierella sp. AD094]